MSDTMLNMEHVILFHFHRNHRVLVVTMFCSYFTDERSKVTQWISVVVGIQTFVFQNLKLLTSAYYRHPLCILHFKCVFIFPDTK